MATDSAGHALVDVVGNTLVVSDIQIASSTAGAGMGATGGSVSTFLAGTYTGTLNVVSSATSVSGGTASKAGIIFGNGGPGIYFGLGTPSALTAATGSLYINTQSSTIAATTAIYVNTTGVSTWVAVL